MSAFLPSRFTGRLTALFLALLLAGCTSLIAGGGGGNAPSFYDLTVPQEGTSAAVPMAMVLVEDPSGSGALLDTGIARRSSPNELAYFAGARWSDRLPVMVQRLMVQTLSEAGMKVSAAGSGAPGRAEFELQIDIRAFEAQYFESDSRPDIRIEWRARLLRLGPTEIVADRVFSVTVPASGGEMLSIIRSFDEAHQDMLLKTRDWLMDQSFAETS